MSNGSHRSDYSVDSSPHSTDGALLDGCRDGVSSAWNTLVDRYERLVFAIACYEGLDADDAADVTQLTFEALLDQLDNILDGDRVRWWLMSVARRQSWRTRERNRRDVTRPTDWETQCTISDGTQERAERQALKRALDQLGEPCRTLLTQLYFDPSEPSYAEVAANMGRSENGIGPTRSRCLAHLREILESITIDG